MLFMGMPKGVFLCAFAWVCIHKLEWYNPDSQDNQLRHEVVAICRCTYNYLLTLSTEIVDHC